MRVLQCKAQVTTKADDDALEDGDFIAIVSAFGNKDSYGDIVVKGAFADDIKAWNDSGDPMPVVWSHDWTNPFAHIGVVKAATETEKGLQIHGHIPLEDRESNPTAAQVYRLLKSRRIKQFSFAYDVLDGGEVETDGERAYELRKLKVHEVGPCLVGVNQSTELVAAKAAVLAAADRAEVRAALDTITGVLDALDEEDAETDAESEDTEDDGETPDEGDTQTTSDTAGDTSDTDSEGSAATETTGPEAGGEKSSRAGQPHLTAATHRALIDLELGLLSNEFQED